MAATAKATEAKELSLLDKLNEQSAPPTPEYLSTLGKNRRTGVINDPFKVGNVPWNILTMAVKNTAKNILAAKTGGWKPIKPEQATKKDYNTTDFYIPDFETEGSSVYYDFKEGDTVERMVFFWGYKAEIEARRAAKNGLWNEQFGSRLGTSEEPGVRPKKDTGYTGGFTTDAGNQTIVGYEEQSVQINPNDPTSDLFRQPEGGQ